jgi:hypothetical protein
MSSLMTQCGAIALPRLRQLTGAAVAIEGGEMGSNQLVFTTTRFCHAKAWCRRRWRRHCVVNWCVRQQIHCICFQNKVSFNSTEIISIVDTRLFFVFRRLPGYPATPSSTLLHVSTEPPHENSKPEKIIFGVLCPTVLGQRSCSSE